MNKFIAHCFFSSFLIFGVGYGDNQTPTVSPILPGSELPFTVSVKQASFSLPQGLQSYVHAVYKDKLLLLGGLTQGQHSFKTGQNTTVFVVDLSNETVYSRSLLDPASGLTQAQVDLLSVTNAQNLQKGNTLYITGGYGIDTASGLFGTKNCLTAIDVKQMIKWVTRPNSSKKLTPYIRQIFDDTFKVSGGSMREGKNGMALLIFGADFESAISSGSDPIYTEQVRRFFIHDNGKQLSVSIKDPHPLNPDPNYRRRDGNILPIIQKKGKHFSHAFVALSGVFTLTNGAWTVPVNISSNGTPSMADPNNPKTFKQGMNNYECAAAELFSRKTGDMYMILFGGITYEYFKDGVLIEDPTLPYSNKITTIKIDKHGVFNQYIMSAEYPVILSTAVNPGNQLLFGADARFFPASSISQFSNHVLSYDACSKESLLGYIIGGIQSTLPDTNTRADTSASSYIFKVMLKKNRKFKGCGC